MAVTWMTCTCDWCGKTTDEYEEIVDATMDGWWFLDGPGGEFCFCSKDCIVSYIPDAPEIVYDVPDTYDFEEGEE
jgi:FlaG/FlaF family flagellin (archaellin)